MLITGEQWAREGGIWELSTIYSIFCKSKTAPKTKLYSLKKGKENQPREGRAFPIQPQAAGNATNPPYLGVGGALRGLGWSRVRGQILAALYSSQFTDRGPVPGARALSTGDRFRTSYTKICSFGILTTLS